MSDRKPYNGGTGTPVTESEAQQLNALHRQIDAAKATISGRAATKSKPRAELVVAGEPTVRQQMHEEALEHQFNRLTEVQQRRVLARLEGQSIGEIATAEGRAKASVRETLETPAVRNVLAEIANVDLMYEDGSSGNLLQKMLMVVVDATTCATRPFVLAEYGGGERIEHVPDYRTRVDAAARVLALIPKPIAQPRTIEAVRERVEITERLGYRETGE